MADGGVMPAITGTPRGGALFATAAVLLVAVGGVVAVVVPVRDAPASGLPLLVGWLLLAGAAVWCAALAVTRAGRAGTSTDASEDRTLRLDTTGVLATALAAELTLITARLARDHVYGTAWASGGVLLALLLGATWRTAAISDDYGSGHTPADRFPTCAAFVLTEVGGGWLTVRFAVEGPLWAAWCLGCAMVALAGVFWLTDSKSRSASDTYEKAFGCVAVLGVAGVVARSAVRGESAAAWWVGGFAAGVLLLIGALVLRQSITFTLSWPSAADGHNRTASLGAQFAGILVPLASLAWAAWGGESWSGRGSGDDRLLGASYLAGAGAVLLVAQSAVLAWTGTTPPRRWMVALVGSVRQLAHIECEHSMPPDYPRSQHRAYDPYYERERQSEQPREREENRNRHLERLDDLMSQERSAFTAFRAFAHPLRSAGVIAINRDTALATGLAIEEIWPRIELVAPEQVKAQVRRRERGVLAWRIVVASAVCTAGVWLLIVLAGLGGFRLEGGSPALLVVGPLLVAAVAVAQARRLLVEVYAAKADAVDVFRYDLARRLHLDFPENPSGMIRLASALSGAHDPIQYPGRRPEEPGPFMYPRLRPPHSLVEDPGLLPDTRLEQLAADVADRVRSDLRADVRQALRDERAFLVREDPARAMLAGPDLAQLARDIADSAAEPVSAHLKGHLTDLQQKFHEDVRAVIRSSLEESVTGPPLTNFVGYLAIELDRRAQSRDQPPVRAEGGTIKAPVGRRVNLVVSVVRDERAQNLASVVGSRPGKDFFVFEPVRVEGGRDARTVSFEAMADSSTLTPLPQRQNLLVEDEKQTTFGFQVPEKEGSHEVWFQLYQAGHLVQVVALKIEAEAAPSTPEPSATTDDV